MSLRSHVARLGFVLLAGLVVWLTVYVIGLASASTDRGDSGPVRIENVRINRLPQDSVPYIEVEIDVDNRDQVAHEIEAWWFLARPGSRQPWNLYSFRSSIQGPHILAAGEETTLSWQEDVTAEPGTYELSVWVHTVDGDVTRHSDGRRLGSPTIRIGSQWSPFSRRAAPPTGLKVSAVQLPAAALDGGLSVPAELSLTVVVTNDTALETVADVRWHLYRNETRLPWNGKPAYTAAALRHQVFPPQRETSIKTSEPISLWPGEYLLRVTVRGADGESDDLFLNDPITVLANDDELTVIRQGPASGPVEIAGLAADTSSFQRGRGSLTASLINRTTSQQDVVVWWFLSRPGSLEPWVEFDFQSKVFGARMAPLQHTILDLSDNVTLAPGFYELSVWVHTRPSEGEELPSDGVWLNRRIEVQ